MLFSILHLILIQLAFPLIVGALKTQKEHHEKSDYFYNTKILAQKLVVIYDDHMFEAFLPSILDEFYLVEFFLPLQFQFQKEHVILCKEVWPELVSILKENLQY